MTQTWALRQPPRAWQLEALGAWNAAQRRGIIAVVTGAGKTAFAELCIQQFITEIPSGYVLVLAPTLALVDQWYVSLRDDLGVRDEEIAVFSGESKDRQWRCVNLAVINSARDLPGPRPPGAGFLIVDECHRAASRENSRALRGKYSATLGMSATPERDYDDGLESVLVPRLGDIVYRYQHSDAVRDGVITPFDLVNVRVEMTSAEQQRYDEFSRKIARIVRRGTSDDPDSVRRLLQQRAAISAAAAIRVPVAVKLVEEHPRTRAIVFHERVHAASAICRLLEQRGTPATLYHTGVQAHVRRDNLRLYRRGVYEALVTCRALDEGLNAPDTGVAVIASSTASTRQRIQRLGRVLRPAPGKAAATVYTLFASDAEARRLVEEETQTAARSVTWHEVSLDGRPHSH